MNSNAQFALAFEALTRNGAEPGYAPMGWQVRLFEEFCRNSVRTVCDLPTGMGKTSVIHLWFLARRWQEIEGKPKLPTRLVYVVDRRTVVDQATGIAERIKTNLPSLGLPDDYLSVSTLRGQFADNRDWTRDPSKLGIVIGTIDMIGSRLLFSGYRSSFKQKPLDAGLLGQDSLLVLDEAHLSEPFENLIRALSDRGDYQGSQGAPMRVMCMSATSGSSDTDPFSLVSSDLEGDAESNPILRRYEARKRMEVVEPTGKVADEIVKEAVKFAETDARVVVFVRRPDDAKKIADAIRKKAKAAGSVEILTGTMRGLERDQLLTKPVMKRFLDGNETREQAAGKGLAVLVSTSAGEVGFDLNADHLMCDAAPLDSMIQRLGRVNRRGLGDATVRVICAARDKADKVKAPWEVAAAEAINYLKLLAKNDDGTYDASPCSIDLLKRNLGRERLAAASSPKPKTAELTDIVLDAWSMTSVLERMPGRPSVAPWLRGLVDDEPETTIVWRKELDLEGFDRLGPEDVEEWFDAHRILPHETLSVPTYVARDWVEGLGRRIGFGGRVFSCLVERGAYERVAFERLVVEAKRSDRLVGATLILPASAGGIVGGMLEAGASASADVADIGVGVKRRRLVRTFPDGVPLDTPLMDVGYELPPATTQFGVDLADDEEQRLQLISEVPKRERPEFGSKKQSLADHVGLVRKYADEIAGRISLSGPILEAVRLAAEWHDHGKDRPIWQRAAGREPGEEPLGKSGGRMRRMANGYRHEFGSLCEFSSDPSEEWTSEALELALHLIATHHGRGRPHFAKGGFDPQDQPRSPEMRTDVIRRFGRLQRKYGYWQLAWLENLLRCADALASAETGGAE